MRPAATTWSREVVEGINHATLAVRDLDRSLAFYVGVLGLRAVARWDGGVYLAAGGDWVTLILDGNVREGPLPEYTHLAFSVSVGSLEEMGARLARAGVEIWQENQTPGESVYLLDPDGHKLELHASDLCGRMAEDRRDPPPGMVFFD